MARISQWMSMLYSKVSLTLNDQLSCFVSHILIIQTRDTGVQAIEDLISRTRSRDVKSGSPSGPKASPFDYILLETTGLADPGNIAPLFWLDSTLGSSIYLDGIVTLVDAKNILRCFDEPLPDEVSNDNHIHHDQKGPLLSTAHLQISHADVIVLNKTDIVDQKTLKTVELRIRDINGLAKVCHTVKSQVPNLEGFILDLHAYDSVTGDDLSFSTKGHSHLDPNITTIALKVPILDDKGFERLEKWLRSVLWKDLELEHPDALNSTTSERSNSDQPRSDIHRTKGRILALSNKISLIQGVREVFEIIDTPEIHDGTEVGKIIFIGRGLSYHDLQSSLNNAICNVDSTR